MSAYTSSVQIANLALSHLGVNGIESFTERSVEARTMKQFYDTCRREVLERFDWSFARKRVALALHPEAAPAGMWEFRYTRPADCVEFRRIQNPLGEQADPVPFRQEAAEDGSLCILTDLDQAIGIYTYDCQIVEAFTTSFGVALSHCLAWRTGFALTKKRSIADYQGQVYANMIRAAAGQNANAATPPPPVDAIWIRSR